MSNLDFQKAIQFIECVDKTEPIFNFKRAMKPIIKLLREGETYKKIWDRLKDEYGTTFSFYPIQNNHYPAGQSVESFLIEEMEFLEQKYLKEVKTNGS